MSKYPLVSIIVPIYNKEKIVSKCIESCINQTLKDIEIILIDDGSTDKSTLICDEYAKIDIRVKVIHKKNGGLSSARNAGLDMASGEYIGFVDGDDYISADMFEILYRTAKKNLADISMCSYYICEGEKIYPKSETGNTTCFGNADAMLQLLQYKKINVSVWNKIYENSLFHNIRFDEKQKYSEDGIVTFKLFGECSKLCVVDIPKYYYIRWEDSQSKEPVNLKSVQDSLRTADTIFSYILERYAQYHDEATLHLAYSYSLNLYRLLNFYGRKNKESAVLQNQLLDSIGAFQQRYAFNNAWFLLRIFLKCSHRHLWLCEWISKVIYKFR